MAIERVYNVPINMLGLEIRNMRMQSLASAPAGGEAKVYYDSVIKSVMFHDGTTFVPMDPRKATNIPLSALATNPLARANHTGTQTASTISDFDTQVRTSRIDQMAVPTANVSWGGMKLTNLGAPTVGSDAATKAYVDAASTTGNAATATALQTARSIALSGVVTATGVLFDGTGNISLTTVIADGALSIAKTAGLQAILDAKQDSLGYTPFNKAGDTMLGSLTLNGDPINPLEAATKQYVDNVAAAAASGIDPKEAVRAATTANIGLTGTQTVGGVALAIGDRVLVKAQTDPSQNGIWIVAAGSWSRATDAVQGKLTTGALTLVLEGTHAGQQWYLQTAGAITVGSTNQTWIQFNAAVVWTNGNGILIVGNEISAKAAPSGGIVVSVAGIAVDTNVVARKAAATIGDGAATAFTITHNLNTQDIVVFIRNMATGDIEYAHINATTVNTVTITFATAPGTNAYRVLILG